jgi:hypothetical protein
LWLPDADGQSLPDVAGRGYKNFMEWGVEAAVLADEIGPIFEDWPNLARRVEVAAISNRVSSGAIGNRGYGL